MLQQITHFFKNHLEIPGAVPVSSREEAIRTATCAILLEAAMADGVLSDEELAHIQNALRRLYGIDDAAIRELTAMALEERKQSLDLWQFTNLINQHYDTEQKIDLL
ncbi:MAG: TerB family tellurite resistance protein, partial [Nitrospirae bacterium]|nr:TerB family tellurite resistance protein [Nitrospirota bacterium]